MNRGPFLDTYALSCAKSSSMSALPGLRELGVFRA
jgi:hypothetical protein